MTEPEHEAPRVVAGSSASRRPEPGQASPSVSVVIPARNAAGTLGAQLEALMVQEYDGDLEIIVVDNGSSDDTGGVAAQFRHGRWPVRVVREPIVGANRARNAGVAGAVGERVLLCDADDIVEQNWVRGLANALGDADLVGGLVEMSFLNTDDTRRMWGFDPIVRPAGDFAGFQSPWGCNCGFRRAAWEAVGGFDEEMLGGSFDEIEFFVRAQAAGFRLSFADRAIVHYRLREDMRSLIRRQYVSGIGEALVAARFGSERSRPRVLGFALRSWAWIVVSAVPAWLGNDRRSSWHLRFDYRRGRLVGSFRYRVFSP